MKISKKCCESRQREKTYLKVFDLHGYVRDIYLN